MKIAVAKEIDPAEPRVAASPDTVKKFRALGVDVAVEPGAGIKSGLLDAEFTAAGATVSATVRKHGRADKVRIIKFRRRKHHKKQQGHRQHFTEVEITGINA